MDKRAYVFSAFETGAVCVFPTEAAARSALVDYALHSETGSILRDRAISFDTFRSRFLAQSETLAPSNTLLRQLFVHQIIDSGAPLSRLINTRYPQSFNRLERTIASMLPSLSIIVGDGELLDRLDGKLRADLMLLYGAYQRFLSEHRLFEPRYMEAALPPNWDASIRYLILYSDTVAQSGSLLAELGYPANIELWPTPTAELALLSVYPNHIQEIRSTIRTIKGMLEEGVESHQIILGCASADTLLPILREEAAHYDLPLSIREGRSPLTYPGGRFLLRLSEVYDDSFSLESLKGLLLDPSVPWADEEVGHQFIRRAIDKSIFEGSVHRNDQFIERLQHRDLVAWYRDLKKSIVGIVESESAPELRRKLNHFQDTYFSEEQWHGSVGEEVYSFCLDTIAEIEQALMRTETAAYKRLFSWLITTLRAKRYVFQQRDSGIAVYAWPQVATMNASHLFVIGLDQEGASVVERPLFFLSDEEERGASDTTMAHLVAASLTGPSVHLSCHLRRYEGETLPPAPFFEQGRLVELKRSLLIEDDPYLKELALWRGETGIESRCLASQRQWFDRARQTTLRPRSDDYTYHPIHRSLVGHLKEERNGQTLLSLSATKIDRFDRCPYIFLARYLLRVSKEEWQPALVDHRLIGNLEHLVLQRFFDAVNPFDSAREEEYGPLLLALFDEALIEVFGERGPTPSIRAWIVSAHRPLLMAILGEERRHFDGERSVGLEADLSVIEGGLYLNGQIDRIVERSRGEHVVIDYKKGDLPMKKMSERPQSYQLPLYQRLIEAGGEALCAKAAYYSVKDGRYVALWDRADSEEASLSRDVLLWRLDTLSQAVDNGELMATPSQKSCKGCEYRPLCRRRYLAP